jgi:hypothetical protein
LRPVVADADHNVEGCDAGLRGVRSVWPEDLRALTTLRVPTNSLGGSIPVVQIIWMKLEQMPMTRIMQMA